MQKLSIAALSLALIGCTTTGTGNKYPSGPTVSPVLFDKPYGTSAPLDNPKVVYTDQNEKPLNMKDINAINAAIAAERGKDLAPQEEVMQQLMTDEI
ncbi:hypothetical protein [Legionella maceachernii]|uniref:Lipoprotein n=1 Tax=Legionella maceachernii TaxID=466 RepID=A0A0W0W6U2_9GAMM|nr:hypothetical protein [Legionella maceachernii]KTD28081.1 hypothetical protein Lmac_1140 [Legionella maceachernii]SKA08186.1 hypothetical protein SAMN02745128_02030 [Legionella maceachernii]SUO99729.1 Uncharacterised protein [Legionella maceachernii]